IEELVIIVNESILRETRSYMIFFFFSSRRRHTRLVSDWSSDVCSSDLEGMSHGAHQAIGGSAKQARIGIERNHVADARRRDARVQKGGGRIAAQPPVEFMKLAAFA